MKLKVKPKKFSKDVKGDNTLGQKRKANDEADHSKKQFKTKKWKGEEHSETGKKGFSKAQRENKKSNNKDFQKHSKGFQKGKFDSDKTRKRKLNDGGGSKDFVNKKRKSSEAGTEHDKGTSAVDKNVTR